MQAPQCGPRRFRALAILALASGTLLFVPSGRAGAAGHNGITSGLIESINDLVGVLGQAVRHGDRKEVRQIDHALEDLLRALDREQKQHYHHHHHKGSAIHKGMQMTGKDRKPFDSLPTATDAAKTTIGKTNGKGNFGRGIGQVSHWHKGRNDVAPTSPVSTSTTSDTATNSNAGVTSGTQSPTSRTATTPQTVGNSGTTKSSIATTSNAKSGSSIAAISTKGKGNTTKLTANALAGNKQVANIGKLPATATASKKANAPIHVAANFAHSGHNVGAAVGQHRPAAHAPVKKK